MTQPVYPPQYLSPMPMLYVDPTPELKKQKNIITLLSVLLVVSVLANVLAGFLILNSGIGVPSLGYKEYSSLAEVYQKAALGDKVKVNVTIYETKPTATGFITLPANENVGVGVRIPPPLKSTIKLYYGRNIVYGQITERNGPDLYLDVDKVEP